MAVKFRVAALDEVPEALKSEYRQMEDGTGFELDCPEYTVQIKGLNRRAADLTRKLDEIQTKYKDVDLELVAQQTQEIEDLKAQLTKKGGKNQEEFEKQLEALAKKHAKETQALQDQIKERDSTISRSLIDEKIAVMAAQYKVLGPAIPDVIGRAKGVFKYEEGKVVAYDADGNKLYGDAGTPLSVEEWIKSLPKSCPHFFPPSQGSAAAGSSGATATATGVNPFKTGNQTEQALMFKADPDKARRLAAEAGMVLPM